MRIFLLSGDGRTTRFLQKAIHMYEEQRHIRMDIQIFVSLRNYMEVQTIPDMIIVDDTFDGKTSVEVAKYIRNKDSKAALILLSVHSEAVFEAFSVRAHRFLMKPVAQSDIFDALDAYRKDLFTYRCIIAKVEETYQVFSSEEIYAVYSEEKQVKVVLKNQVMETGTSFQQMEVQLPDEYFYKVHRNYVVNLKHILSFSGEEIKLRNQVTVPLSRRKKMDFLIRYTEFVQGHTFTD